MSSQEIGLVHAKGMIHNCNSSSFSDQDSEDDPNNRLNEGNVVLGQSGNEGSSSNLRNAIVKVAELRPDSGGHEGIAVEMGVGFSGRKEGSRVTESVESLRTILSDPLTGVLMDDAMILPCGHSFGSGGLEHVLRTKACYKCLHGISENSASPNLLLRAAVQAFRREEELHASRASKRRRERYDQEKGGYGDSTPLEHSRRKSDQIPFSLTDRVIIMGNKRTPPRFVGREAIVVNQCLNGWYVVKTVDNSEQVKLQYRSLSRVPDAQCS